ncbi:hypothetical protein SIID45300_01767 [Candidatus Magnetaquicoccaceae bacterium FCR-1]|uniref:Secreted protein n=1 Tax=Candidatus Magnetaquiglobus chichijimensis TaxID=3141448 RepID=A0ABQ0C973_9PROT
MKRIQSPSGFCHSRRLSLWWLVLAGLALGVSIPAAAWMAYEWVARV